MLTPQQITELAETLYPALDDLNRWITLDMIQRFMGTSGPWRGCCTVWDGPVAS